MKLLYMSIPIILLLSIQQITCLTYDTANENIFDITTIAIPAGNTYDVVDYGGNDFNMIPSNYFSNLSSIITLKLGSNNISEIQDSALSGIPTTRRLYLESNRLQELRPAMFLNLTSLEELYLWCVQNIPSAIPRTCCNRVISTPCFVTGPLALIINTDYVRLNMDMLITF